MTALRIYMASTAGVDYLDLDLDLDPTVDADFNATPLAGRMPLSVAFVDLSTTSSGSPTAWLWDFGDGATSTEQNPTHVFTSYGRHTISLRASRGASEDTETKLNYITVARSRIKREDMIGEYCTAMDDIGDLHVEQGLIARDYGPSSRCRMRLRTKRGSWPFDPTMGSRLHTLGSLRNARRNINRYVQEALQPLIDDGSIKSVAVATDPATGMPMIETDDRTGRFAVQIEIAVAGDDARISLGQFVLGGQ